MISINLQHKIEKKISCQFWFTPVSSHAEFITFKFAARSLLTCRVRFISSPSSLFANTQNRYSLTLNVGSGLTYHERDDIYENIIAYITTYSAKFPRLSVLIKKPLFKKEKITK